MTKRTIRITKHHKLVRDLIPHIIKQDGKQAIYDKVKGKDEKLSFLNHKLTEEVDEYISGNDIDELADVLEVVYSILKLNGYTIDYLEGIREDKKVARGGFDEGVVLKEVREEL